MKNGFGEAVVAYDMPEPRKFPSLDSCRKGFLWTHTEVYRVPHPVVGLVLQVGDAEKFPDAFSFESLDQFFFRVNKPTLWRKLSSTNLSPSCDEDYA